MSNNNHKQHSRKLRVLFIGEASYLNSGYAVYIKEILKRFHKCGEFEIAEFAPCGEPKEREPRVQDIPWAYYPNIPDRANKQEFNDYNSSTINAFGMYSWNSTILNFMPDLIVDIRDIWMMKFEVFTPLKRFYKVAWIPTVDSPILNKEWISIYQDCDYIFGYTEWALNILKSNSNNMLNLCGIAGPGADVDTFVPVVDKAQHKESFGLPKDAFIVGTVMRNQKRKLFPDLFDSFKLFLHRLTPEQQQKCYLYLHTGYPDSGWDLPEYITNSGISSKILCSYQCNNCGHFTPSFFNDAVSICPKCGKNSLVMASVSNGVPTNTMCDIYNLFDVYVQYSICEAAGMPQLEAASCGVPIMAPDHSAMGDIVRKTNGYLIDVAKDVYECTSNRVLCYPDNADLAQKLFKYYVLPNALKQTKQQEAREGILLNYTYDKSFDILYNTFKNIEVPSQRSTWFSPPQIIQPNTNVPEGLTNESFVRWCIINVLGMPEKLHSALTYRIIRDLNYGFTSNNPNRQMHDLSDESDKLVRHPYTRESILKEFIDMRHEANKLEEIRMQHLKNFVPLD